MKIFPLPMTGVILLVFSACSPLPGASTGPAATQTPPATLTASPAPSLTPSATPTPAPSATAVPCAPDCTDQTVLRFIFPIVPAFPGYIVDISSPKLELNLMCVLKNGQTAGELSDMKGSSNQYGVCDSSSVRLFQALKGDLTVTVILGGFPVVNRVTKSPSPDASIVPGSDCTPACREIEYDFTTP